MQVRVECRRHHSQAVIIAGSHDGTDVIGFGRAGLAARFQSQIHEALEAVFLDTQRLQALVAHIEWMLSESDSDQHGLAPGY